MAVATPVLERKINQPEIGSAEKTVRTMAMTADEIHNSMISDNFARLMNTDYKIKDLFSEEFYIKDEREPEPEMTRGVYRVENARADNPIFRADNPINARTGEGILNAPVIGDVIAAAPVVMEAEEESEDLRPTQTTIQYRTIGDAEKINEENSAVEKKESLLGKKEKIIISTFIGIVLALFALVIINSVIIANFNTDISAIQNGITTVKGGASGALSGHNFQAIADGVASVLYYIK